MTNEEALKKFLLDIDCLNELLPWTGKFNLFDVLRISRTEIRHSNMLAWLLNANENHGMGDAYVKALVQKLVANDSAGRYDVFQLALMDFYSFTVQREWNNIDILLTSSEEKTLIAFENKVGAHEHSDQLNRYRKILEKAYPDYCRIYLYLTPDGELPSDEEYWDVMTYLDIVETLESVSGGIDLIPDVRLMIDNYIAIIRRDIVDDQQLIEICDKIYKKHQKALDLIFEHRVNNRGQIAAAVRETLQQMSDEGSIVFDANSINSCLYASISSKTSVFIGFSRPFFLFLSPTTPFLHHFTFNYTFSRTFPFPRTACPLLRGNTSPLSFVMCHVPKVSVMFWGSCHIRLLL